MPTATDTLAPLQHLIRRNTFNTCCGGKSCYFLNVSGRASDHAHLSRIALRAPVRANIGRSRPGQHHLAVVAGHHHRLVAGTVEAAYEAHDVSGEVLPLFGVERQEGLPGGTQLGLQDLEVVPDRAVPKREGAPGDPQVRVAAQEFPQPLSRAPAAGRLFARR